MRFDEARALEQLERMTRAQLDALPFGVVGLDAEAKTSRYNAFERTASGLSDDFVLGKSFFDEVAPCMNNYLVAERFKEEEFLDEQLSYVLTLRMRPTKVRLRLLRAPGVPTAYLLVERRI